MSVSGKGEMEKINEAQLKVVMDSHGEALIRLAYLYVKDWSAAEDIMQDVFITYYQKSDQFENRSSLKTYLFKMTINKCNDHLRSWKNKKHLFSDSLGKLMSSSKSPEETYIQQTDQADLIEKVMRLPIKYREVILLFYFQEFTSKEISLLLNCSENTVKTRLRRAKDLLKETIDPREREGLSDEQL